MPPECIPNNIPYINSGITDTRVDITNVNSTTDSNPIVVLPNVNNPTDFPYVNKEVFTTKSTPSSRDIPVSTIPFISSLASSDTKVEQNKEYKTRLCNKDLCFFQAIVSCPPKCDLTKLIAKANTTGYIPTDYEINATLLALSVHTEHIHPPNNQIALPTVQLSINPHSSLIHLDNGASVSMIRESIALQLGTPLFKLEATSLKDINSGVVSFKTACYIQIEVPNVPDFRAVILCLVQKDFHMPFLLGASDQRAFNINPQIDSKHIRFGPQSNPQGTVRYLAQNEWQKSLNRSLNPVTSTQLALENKELLRKVQLAKIYQNLEPIIEVLSHSGMCKQKTNQPIKLVHPNSKTCPVKQTSKSSTKVSTEEIRQALRTAPVPSSPSITAVHNVDHQIQLLHEPSMSRLIDNERKYDQWNNTTSVNELREAKMNPAITDQQLAQLERLALQEGLRIYHPTSNFPTIPNQQFANVFSGMRTTTIDTAVKPTIHTSTEVLSTEQVSSIQEYIDCLNNLREHTTEIDPEITPENPSSTIYSSSAPTFDITNDTNLPTLPPPTSVSTEDIYLNVLNAYLTASSDILNPDAVEPITDIYTEIELDVLFNDDRLPPSNHEREYLPVFSGQVKPSKPPNKPTTSTETEEPPLILQEEEFLDPDWVPSQKIAALNDTIYSFERLKHVQDLEQQARTANPTRKAELEAELAEIVASLCKLTGTLLKPDDFPDDLWQYVLDEQKPLVAARFALFPANVRADLLEELLTKLDISTNQGVTLERFMRAQAIANLDTFGYPDPYTPPTIPGYTFRIQTVHDQPIYKNPTRFNQQETAFLEARVYELVNLTKVEPAPNSPHNCPLVLVPYNDRIKASITKWTAADLNPVEEMFKPSNYKEVSQWYRLTNNLKALNDVTIPYRYPMPDQEDPKHFTKGSRFWSATDIKDAFYCIKLHPDDRDKTAFTTPRGRFRFTVMPQGATNSPKFFAHVAQDTFQHIPKSELLNFIDDTTNHSRTFKQHLITQQTMYDALRSKRLIMKVSKSHFLQDSIRVLGHIFNEFGHTPDPIHIKNLMEMAPPTDQKGVRSFIGLLNFNHKYIPRFSELTGPLNDLLCKDTNGQPTDVAALWQDDVHGEVFRKAKIALTSAPCMMAIDVTKPFMLHVDSCKNGRGPGAVLLQQNDEADWRPVSYFSCRLRKGEQSWSATELEAMGLVYAIRYWSSYLKVQKFTAVVDHHALIWLVIRPAKTANGRILHWISDLQEYTFDIVHRAGAQHLDADAISRLLHYSDLPQRFPDSTDLLEPVTGTVTNESLVEAYRHMIQQRDYYLYLTSKTFLATNGINTNTVQLPEPDKRHSSNEPNSSEDPESSYTNEIQTLPLAYEDELLFPNLTSTSTPIISSFPITPNTIPTDIPITPIPANQPSTADSLTNLENRL